MNTNILPRENFDKSTLSLQNVCMPQSKQYSNKHLLGDKRDVAVMLQCKTVKCEKTSIAVGKYTHRALAAHIYKSWNTFLIVENNHAKTQ